MEVNFTFDEMVYNGGSIIGKKLWHEEALHEIEYVKLVKDTRQIKVHCVNGDVFIANQDEEFTWEVSNENQNKPVTKKKIKKKKK